MGQVKEAVPTMTPDTSPTALARLRERLDTEMHWPQPAMGIDVLAIPHLLCGEASAAILALEKELGQVRADLRTSSNDANELMRQLGRAEARLLEIAEIADPLDVTRVGSRYRLQQTFDRIAAIARSKPAEGEG